MRKPAFAIWNIKGADQPAHPRSLIRAFVVRCLDSIIPLFAIAEISSADRFEPQLVANPEDRFSCDVAQFYCNKIVYLLEN